MHIKSYSHMCIIIAFEHIFCYNSLEGCDFMAFDGIVVNSVVNEIKKNLNNGRIEKVYMPTKNDIVLIFHSNREKLKLLISIDASNARFYFTKQSKENPAKAPQFCMVLRKYIQGAKLIEIKQYGLDRVVSLEVENINELGDVARYKLFIELMGKYSNVILVNNENKILDSMRHVDYTMSSIREVLPAREYILPGTLDKNEFIGMDFEQFAANLQLAAMDPYFSLENMSKIIANQFVGFSKTFIDNLLKLCSITDKFNIENTTKMYNVINLVLYNSSQGLCKLLAYDKDYHIDLEKFETSESSTHLSDFLDEYYQKKELLQSIKTVKFNLQKDVLNFKGKYEKNLKRVNEILAEASNMEKYKLYGELISANIYRLETGMKEAKLENYYENNESITIPLKENYTPARNAQAYFKKYNKLKSAITYATTQKEDYEKNIDYLEDVEYLIEEAGSIDELEGIKLELHEAGYIKWSNGKKKYHDDIALTPHEYSMDGITILVGRNNIQNDRLTLKESKKSYTWLHTKDFHGSHVIVKSDDIPDKVLEYAASLAVLHSQAKGSSKVAVDYTLVKFVHKPNGAKPGKVIYTNYKTIIV